MRANVRGRLPEKIRRRVLAAAVVVHHRVKLHVVRGDLELVRRVALVSCVEKQSAEVRVVLKVIVVAVG